jgi:dTMP kinase
MTRRGKFITLEGIDGAGKSSHLETVRALLERNSVTAIMTREPGGTPLGEKLRELLLREPMSLEAETLLMFAARAEHIAKRIEPALAAGTWVVSDRFTDATYAYQGGGRGIAPERLAALERWVQGALQPDLTLVFDVPVAVGMARRQRASAALDRFEQEQSAFFERVRAAYLERAVCFPTRIRVITSDRPESEVKMEVEDIVLSTCF